MGRGGKQGSLSSAGLRYAAVFATQSMLLHVSNLWYGSLPRVGHCQRPAAAQTRSSHFGARPCAPLRPQAAAAMTTAVYEDWGSVLYDLDPFVFAFVGAGLAIGLSVLGAAWGIFITGSSVLGAAVRAPRIRSIISSSTCKRPAVSIITVSIAKLRAIDTASLATRTASFCSIEYTGTSTCDPSVFNWFTAAGR